MIETYTSTRSRHRWIVTLRYLAACKIEWLRHMRHCKHGGTKHLVAFVYRCWTEIIFFLAVKMSYRTVEINRRRIEVVL